MATADNWEDALNGVDSEEGKNNRVHCPVVLPRNPKLIRGKIEEEKQAPSAFLAEMQLTTEEKLKLTCEMRIPQIIELLDMSETTHQKFTTLEIDEPMFQPFPSDIVFQNCEPYTAYQVPLRLRNNDKVARLIKVTQTDSPYFKIISPSDVGHKVAPGMDKIFMIQFTADQKKDYFHEVICVTEREKFLIPVKAIGNRAIIDFPDAVNFGNCPVKDTTTKTLFVRNIGNREAKFTLTVPSPFLVNPDQGCLPVSDSMQIHVDFKAMKTGDYDANMILHYDTGEDVYITLYGAANDINVRLDKNALKLENTFISCTSQRTAVLHNRSEHIVNFRWTKFATLQEELQHKERSKMEIRRQEEMEKEGFHMSCVQDVTIRDQFSILQRSFQTKKQIIDDDKLPYKDDVIEVEPLEGVIWPNSSMEIDIAFTPVEARSYARTLYCDVTGRESRLPLRIRGEGMGPRVAFSLDALDIGNIFISSQHSYEVVLVNKGDIDAYYSYIQPQSMFGPLFTFSPCQGIVRPDGYQAIKIDFCSPILGILNEDFYWAIEGSPEKLVFNIRGCVIGPTFHFDVPRLDFGIISYGFQNTKYCTLINTSLVPMTFTLRVPSDETNQRYNLLIMEKDKKNREFEILPRSETLPPQSSRRIQINLTSTTVKKYDVSLVVDVDGVGTELASLPLIARCIVPPISLLSPVLDYSKCFLNHPYEMTVDLMNETDLPAKYEIIEQIQEHFNPLLFSSPEPKGILNPHTITKVPIQIVAQKLEEIYAVANLLIYGSSEPPLIVELRCFGEGPVVHVSPLDIDWGNIPVLTNVQHNVVLSNESLIPATFTCAMVRPKTSFLIEPSEGTIPPEEDFDVVITANVDDCIRFQDKAVITIGGNQRHTISVSAYGQGTTIVADPPMVPTVNFGPQFSRRACCKWFKLTNNGRRTQQLYWMTEGFSNYKAKVKERRNKDDKTIKDVNSLSNLGPVFKLTPERLSLDPGQSQKIKLEGISQTPQIVKEKMICHSIVGNSIGKEVIMKVNIKADFISPLVNFSEKKINFCILKYPETELEKEVKQLIMANVSSLPLSLMLRLEYPFQFVIDDSQQWQLQTTDSSEITLDVNESIPVLIEFDPAFEENAFSRTTSSQLTITYKEHPHEDSLELSGGVYYPNLTFETDKVDFGCILNDTEVTRCVVVSNNSPMEVKYQWLFIDSDIRVEKIARVEVFAEAKEEKTEDDDITNNDVNIVLFDNDEDEGLPEDCAEQNAAHTYTTTSDLGIQEVFDILPLYCTLKSNESQRVQFTFYGHSGVRAKAMARCAVVGGPNYDLLLSGSASLASYCFDTKYIDYGKQLYDQAAVSEITLLNSGQVGLDFVTINPDASETLQAGKIIVTPSRAHVKALQRQKITIKYLPGVPVKFEKSFMIRVGHFEPETITLRGEGVFPRLLLDLPRYTENPRVHELLETAKRNLENAQVTHEDVDEGTEDQEESSQKQPYKLEEFLEVERLRIMEFASQTKNVGIKNTATNNETTSKKNSSKRTKPRPLLAEYLLDFGYVISDTFREVVFHASNYGYCPVSFSADKMAIYNTGFTLHLDRVRNLPGYPEPESVPIAITFDPKAANIQEGIVQARVPINIVNGPSIGIILKATVTLPDINLSSNNLSFGVVQCGNCKVMTIQLFNNQQVSCEWTSEPAEDKKKKIDKLTPLHLRKKRKDEPAKPKHFEIMPPYGTLYPGQRINVQVKFMPTEEVLYNQRLKIHLSQSSNKHIINVSGEGSEPKVEFTSSVLEFGPVLPHSFGDERELTVLNPCDFPVEIYSLEFDKQYLDEEKILRSMKGYDEYNTILLPPRKAGERLPTELTQQYYDDLKVKEEKEKQRAETVAKMFDDQVKGDASPISDGSHTIVPVIIDTEHLDNDQEPAIKVPIDIDFDKSSKAESPEKTDVGELEITPVSAAIANYLGIDLTPEGRAARNRRGIAIVVHGAPFSGKTATSNVLAKMYNAALLSIDSVVTEAIQQGTSTAGLRARELCASSAKMVKEAAEGKDASGIAGALSVEAVAAHTAQTSLATGLPNTASAIGMQSSTLKESKRGGNLIGPKGSQVSKNQPQIPASPPSSPPSAAEPPRRLSVSASVAGEDGVYSCILPEDLLVELLAERMQASDCHLGIVIDSLESIFTKNYQSAATCILRALNNRKYIFFTTLTLELTKLKAIEEQKKQQTLKLEKEKAEAEKKWLEEMSEDEYDNLSEQEKNEVDKKRLLQKKERMKRDIEEKNERERKEREQQALLEEKKLEEERGKTGRRKTVQQNSQSKKGHSDAGKELKDNKKDKSSGTKSAQVSIHDHTRAFAPSVISERSDSCDLPTDDRKRMSVVKMPKLRQASANQVQHPPAIAVDDQSKEESEKDKELAKKFSRFETSLRDVSSILDYWDRSIGDVIRVETPKSENEPDITQTGSNKKMRDKKGDKEKEREKEREKEKAAAAAKDNASPRDSLVFKEDAKAALKEGVGVPHVVFETTEPGSSQKDTLLSLTALPTPEEILDGLGLGPNGPPIPPAASFAVVPYPVRRHSPFASDASLHYLFVASGPNDPNVIIEEKKPESDIEKPDSRTEKEHIPRGKSTSTRLGKEERDGGSKSKRERLSSSGKTGRRGSVNAASPTPHSTADDGRSSGDPASVANAPLTIHRWVIPAKGSTLLRVRFKSEELGQFDQTLNFELVGTRRRYQVFCRGICSFPTISREPRVVFPSRRKFRKREEILQKKFVLNTETYEFGPLLCGKTREKYKEGRYVENMEKLTISNTSPLPGEVSFCFQNDDNGTTFLLDPPHMSLKAGESKTLNLWAYPKTAGHFDDILVCCIRENPEPITFKISCDGVRPELELDRKQLAFDRVLLHRKDTRTVFLRNSTLLPVAWKLNGLEGLGDDFSVIKDNGVIEPRSEYGLQVHFRAARPTTVKKIVRLEISDVEQIMGLVQAENIQIVAEAYDIALDMSFPKGADGGLDFGVLKVFDENKQTMSLKNKGRYEISYNFVFDTANTPNIGELLTIVPQKGLLLPTERPTAVSVVFRSRTEVNIKDETVIKCQIIEPHLGDGGEIIASIPVKVSVRSVHSKYSIFPKSDINFGAILVNTKKSRMFTIENKGEFEFRYTIMKMISPAGFGRPKQVGPNIKRTKSREGSSSTRSQVNQFQTTTSLGAQSRPKRADSVKGSDYIGSGAPNIRQQIGMFTVYPAVGVVTPASSIQIAVDMMGENTCCCEEELAIDITDRNPNDNPQGIPYKLIGETAIPGISVINPEYIGSIFEEHRVVQSLTQFQYHGIELGTGTGIYGEQENKFLFCNSVVGHKSQARFKISNPNKIPCDIVVTVKPTSSKPSAKWHDVFEVQPSRACIGSYDSVYVTVSFTPPVMQSYSALFEAAVDGMTGVVSRYRNLSFEINGDGNLPRINVQRPSTRNKNGTLAMYFKPLLVGRAELLPLVLSNDGTLDAYVRVTLTDPEKAFTVIPLEKDGSCDGTSGSNMVDNNLSICLIPGKSMEFAIQCVPTSPSKMIGEVRLSVRDNPYEETVVQLLGEGYKEDVTIDNIDNGDMVTTQDGVIDRNDINQLYFGDCCVGVAKKSSLTLTNHLPHDAVKFIWSPCNGLVLSPCVGHLLPNCAKDIAISYTAEKPTTLTRQAVACKVMKIKLAEDTNKAVDWDDRMRTVKWVDAGVHQATREDGPGSAGQRGVSEVGVSGRERPTKKKVYEIEPEPPHTVLEESAKSLTLGVNAKVNYAQCKSSVTSIHFKDTLMFQTRIYSFVLNNTSTVKLDYSIDIIDTFDTSSGQVKELGLRTASRSSPVQEQARPGTAMGVVYENGRTSSYHALSDGSPFSVEPTKGCILAGDKVTINLRFAPYDIKNYQALLKFTIPNLQPSAKAPEIEVKGRSLLPYCHFELEDSDYITGGRRNPELEGPGGAPPGTRLPPNTKVIEFQSCGVNVKVTREFYIVNPTDMDIHFVWSKEDPIDHSHSSPVEDFTCVPHTGVIESGKKTLIKFGYISQDLELTESFWRFFIQEHNISVPFLLVGHTTEPAVSMDRSHFNFREILIGHPVEEIVHLVNDENKPFQFSFDPNTCYTDAFAAQLFIEPMSGVIPPKSRLPVRLSFTASVQKEINFNVVCKIKKKTSVLTLNVKAEGYAMMVTVICEDSTGTKIELTPEGLNRIQFGEVEINEKAFRQLFISNSGKFNFDYNWVLKHNVKTKRDTPVVAITPEKGTVPLNNHKRCQLSFCPPSKIQLQNCKLLLKITNGPTYNIEVTGCGVRPKLNFSFNRHDFGPCFLYRAGIAPRTEILTITNEESKDTSVLCKYKKTPYLDVDFPATILTPGQSIEATILFYPRECKRYHEVIPFEINGLSQTTMEIFGEGTDIKVDVVNPEDRKINFGALRVGQSAERVVQLRNNSAAAITFTIVVTPSAPHLQQSSVLSLRPTSEITLLPNGGTTNVHVTFSPKSRLPQFVEEVMLECSGLSQTVFLISGLCQAVDVKLDSSSVPFGAVVEGSRSTRMLVMQNYGDIGASFAWNIEQFTPDFSIEPIKGYSSPGSELPFEITFTPKTVSQDIRNETSCIIEGGKTLKLVLTGSCVQQMPMKEVLHFNAHVRSRDTRHIVLNNRSNLLWDLRPLIDGIYWTGADVVVVEPQQSKNYELVYRPLVMTQEGKKHQGSVFFALPDGNGLLYNLTGVSDPPRAISNIQRDVPCKTHYTELLSVNNWLKRPQRFRVIIEMVKPEKLDGATTIKGLHYIDIPGQTKKEYKLDFYAHKEGTFSAKIIFKNEQTNEYQFYFTTFKATPAGIISTIDLSTPVRQSVSHSLTIYNPLATQVNFSTASTVTDIQLAPGFGIPPQSEGSFSFDYLPLRTGEVSGRLTLSSTELGYYQYDLNLTATTAGPESQVHFRTTLGSSHSQTCRFTHFCKYRVEYLCKVDNSEFHVERSITAASASSGGIEVNVEVTYEPSRLGNTRATLLVTSPTGGDFTFPLYGYAAPPKPQGPHTIKAGSSTSIPFKNVFPSTTQFTMHVDNPVFNVKPAETVRSKKVHNIIVAFDGNQGDVKTTRMGRLVVTCSASAKAPENVEWVFYLKGVTP